MTHFLCLLLFLAAPIPAHGQDARGLYPAAHAFRVTVRAGASDAFEAVANAKLPAAGKGDVVVEIDSAYRVLRRVTCQRAGHTLYLHVPGLTRHGSTRTFMLYAGAPDDAAAPDDAPPLLSASQHGNSVAVRNDYYHIAFSPRDGTFFPAFALPGSALRRDVYLNDRVWDRAAEKKGHWPKLDMQAKVTLEQAGPLVAAFRVGAGYKHTTDDEAVARAVYRYECRAGSPLIRVTARVSQKKDRAWSELHFLHLSHRGDAYPNWASERPRAAGAFTDSKKAWLGHGWAVLHDGRLAVGLVKPAGSLTLYDEPHGFCEYLRDWAGRWKTREKQFAGTVFIGPWRGIDAMTQLVRTTSGVEVGSVAKVDRSKILAAKTPLQKWALERKMAGLPTWPGKVDLAVVGPVVKRAGDLILLHDADTLALFHRQGGLMGLCDARTGHDFVRSTNPAAAWQLQVGKAAGESQWVDPTDRTDPADPKAALARDGLTFTWRNVAGALTVRTRWRLTPAGLCGRLRVEGKLPNGEGILLARFPTIEKLGMKGAIDVAIPRGNWGFLHRNFDGRQGGVYPSGNWPMQFLGVTSGRNSLYLATADGAAELKRFSCTGGGEFYFEFVPADLGVPGKTFDPGYDVVLQPVQGDWLAVAKRYRRWALHQVWCSKGPLAQRNDIPKRYRDGMYWWQIGGAPASVEPKLMAAKKRFAGVPLADHWYNWHVIPFDNDYPHYNPAKPGFKEAVKRLQDAGITIMPYINGRLWDSDTKEFPTVALPAATKNARGEPYIEIYGSGEKLAAMCPYTKVWQDKMVEVTNWLFNDQGVDAIYMDQIGAARPRICMDPAHGHPLGGGGWWLQGYTQMLTRIQAMTENTPRQRLLTTENNAEPYINLIDGFLVWTDRWPDQVPLYAAVYSDMRIAFVSQVSPADTPTAFAMKVGRDFLWGTQLGWLSEWLLDARHREQCDYMVTLAKARLALNEFLSYGEYLGPADIVCPVDLSEQWVTRRAKSTAAALPAVMGAQWRAPNGARAIILTNFDDVAHAVDVAIPPDWRETGFREEDPLGQGRRVISVTDGRACRVLAPGRGVRVLRFYRGAPRPRPSRHLPPLRVIAGSRLNRHNVPDVVRMQGLRVGLWPVEVLPKRMAKLTLLGKPLRARETTECELEYRLAPEDADFRLRLMLPEGVWAQPSAVIAPDPHAMAGRVRVLLRADKRLKGGAHRIPVVIERELAASQMPALAPRKEFTLSHSKPVKVDGDLADWKDAAWVALDGKTGNHLAAGQWTGPKDLSCKAAARAHGGKLYLAFDVADDVHHPPAFGREMWRGDCIQIDFDPLLDSGSKLDGNDIELAAALTQAGPKPFFWTPPPKSHRVAITRRGGGTTYEIALPLNFVTRSGQSSLSEPVGFSFTINDADAAGSFEGWLEWTPGICGAKNPAMFGLLAP